MQKSKWPLLKKDDNVQIIYRNQIKIHYATQKLAQEDCYSSFDPLLDLSRGGIVYPFTGIRGDAKDLWRKVSKGEEKHAELVRADTLTQQKMVMSNADIIIVACGYHTN
jgi:hypothetical protein